VAIKDRKNRRLIRAGIIRLGHKVTKKRSNGSEYTYPVQDDHFLLHDAPDIQAFYEAKGVTEVRELQVLLPFPDIARNLDANYQVWAGKVLVCEGDGEYVSQASPFTTKLKGERTSVSAAPGDTLVSNGVAQCEFDWNGTSFVEGELVPCPGQRADMYPQCAACKLSVLLKVMMADPALFRMAYYQIHTGSGRNHDTILGTLEAMPADRVNGIPFTLRLVEEGTSYTGDDGKRHATNKWFLQLEPEQEYTRALYARVAEEMIETPPAQIEATVDAGPDWDEFEADEPAPPPYAEVQDVESVEEEPPDPHTWTESEAADLFAWTRNTQALTDKQTLEALGVERVRDYTGDLDAAKAQIEAWTTEQVPQ